MKNKLHLLGSDCYNLKKNIGVTQDKLLGIHPLHPFYCGGNTSIACLLNTPVLILAGIACLFYTPVLTVVGMDISYTPVLSMVGFDLFCTPVLTVAGIACLLYTPRPQCGGNSLL